MESLDRNVLDQLGENMGGDGAVTRIVSMYLGKLPAEAAALHEAADSGDLGKLAEDAHRLKSSTAMLGATELGRILAGIEAAAKAGETVAVSNLLAEFDLEREDVERDMRSLTQGAT